MGRIILLLPILLCTPACGPAPATPALPAQDRATDALLGLMRQRLEVMHDVARYKWANKAAIEDPKREAALLEDVAGRAAGLGLDPDFAQAFFRGQIEAAKIVQQADSHRWQTNPEGAGGAVPDLARDLRPRIDALNGALLAELAKGSPRSRRDVATRLRARAARLLVGDGIDDRVREAAISPLIATSQ